MSTDDEPPQGRWRGFFNEVALALAFLSRLPTRHAAPAGGHLAEAAHAFPIAGLVLGAAAGLVYVFAWKLGLYPLISALLAVAFLVWLTRGLHEDGLADFADAMGGHTPARRLEIMRDSRIGSYGALALGLTLALRVAALAEIADPVLVLKVLFASAATSRAGMGMLLYALPPARGDGLSFEAGRPRAGIVWAGAATGLVVSLLLLPWNAALVAVALTAVAVAAVGRLAKQQLGGQTGDVLGAAQQAGEVAFLLAGAVLLA